MRQPLSKVNSHWMFTGISLTRVNIDISYINGKLHEIRTNNSQDLNSQFVFLCRSSLFYQSRSRALNSLSFFFIILMDQRASNLTHLKCSNKRTEKCLFHPFQLPISKVLLNHFLWWYPIGHPMDSFKFSVNFHLKYLFICCVAVDARYDEMNLLNNIHWTPKGGSRIQWKRSKVENLFSIQENWGKII